MTHHHHEALGWTLDPLITVCLAQPMETVGDIGGDGHVGKESELLKDQPDPALLRRQIDATLGIEEGACVECYPAGLGTSEAGDAAKHGALATT